MEESTNETTCCEGLLPVGRVIGSLVKQGITSYLLSLFTGYIQLFSMQELRFLGGKALERTHCNFLVLNKQERDWLCIQSNSDRTRANGFKLEEGTFRLDTRKNFFNSDGSETLAQLPREAVGAPSLEALKTRLDGALGSLSWWEAALHTARVGAGWALRALPTQGMGWF